MKGQAQHHREWIPALNWFLGHVRRYEHTSNSSAGDQISTMDDADRDLDGHLGKDDVTT